jgi:hypothetical protein
MPRTKSTRSGPGERVRALPWAAVLRAALLIGRRVGSLSGRDRARLGELLRKSRGWPGRLGERERAELRKLLAKLDLRGLGRELLPVGRGGRWGRGKRS